MDPRWQSPAHVRHIALAALAALTAWTLGGAVISAMAQQNDKPSIKITRPAPVGEGGPDEMGSIAGTANGPDLAHCKVVLYAWAVNKWYVQPFVERPYTDINDDGRWEEDIHLGHRYAAMLVKRSYRPPAELGTLPKVGGEILAVHQVAVGQPQDQPARRAEATDQAGGKPAIKITRPAPVGEGGPDEMGSIAGTASGPDLADCKVVLYTWAGNKWWVQPFTEKPYTDINGDGTWETDIHLGRKYAALLVRSSYKPPATPGTLPKVGKGVVAIYEAAAKK
jgi:hypothetical protein